MTSLLALIVSGSGVASLLFWLVGVVVVFAIVFFILKTLGAPEKLFTVLYVVGAIILLLVAIDFFFGSGRGDGEIRVGGDKVIVK